ncbi:MAG TPA: MFS transporter [Candidatus Binataceae bacterium]|nr:MFS transporter [Candidatus Binataceae bacterium]
MSEVARSNPQPAAQPGATGGYGRDFWAVFAANFALNGASNMLVIFPLFVVRLGGGAAMIGAIAAFGSAMALLARPAVPLAIGRMGRRSTVFWALAIEGLALTLYIPLQALGLPMFAVRALHGVCEGTARVALFAMLFDILPASRHAEAMTIFSLNGMMPAAFAPMIGDVIVRRLGFTAFFITAAALCGCGAIATVTVSDELGFRAPTSEASDGGVSYRRLLLDRALLPVWIATLLFSAAIVSRLNFVAPFAIQQGVLYVGVYFVIYSAAAIVVRLTCGRVIERVGAERILALSLVTLGVGIGLICATGRPGMLDLAGVVGGLGHGLSYPALSLLVLRRTPAAAMGRTSTIYTSLFDVAAMSAPYLLGLIASRAGYGPMFVIAGLCALGAGLYIGVVERVLHRRIA